MKPRRNPITTRAAALGALALTSLAPAGCLRPSDAEPVAALNLRSAEQLARAYARDLGALRALASALLAIEGERVRLRVELAIASECLTPAGAPDNACLDDPGAANALRHALLAGEMTRAQAERWLRDYVASLDTADDDARAELLGALAPIRDHRAGADALLAAIDARRDDGALLAADLLASSATLASFTAFDPLDADTARAHLEALWTQGVLDHIGDDEKRAAAGRMFDRILAAAAD